MKAAGSAAATMSLLGDLLFGIPFTLTMEIFKKLLEEVEKEALFTEESVKKKLQEYQLLLDNGSLTEAEYDTLETKLIQRLHEIRAANKQSKEGK